MPPAVITMRGNPDLKSEVLYSYELGYRTELARRFSLAAQARPSSPAIPASA